MYADTEIGSQKRKLLAKNLHLSSGVAVTLLQAPLDVGQAGVVGGHLVTVGVSARSVSSKEPAASSQ
jgi:hypothetical protein